MSGTRYDGQLNGSANDVVPNDPQSGFYSLRRVQDPTGLPAGLYLEFQGTAEAGVATNTGQLIMDANGVLWTRRSVDLASTWTAWQSATNVAPFVPTSWNASEVQASGTGGGNAVNGVNTRVLNTLTNAGPSPSSVTLAANQLTLQPGTYRVTASAPGLANLLGGLRHILYLYDVTNAATAIRGSSEGSLALLNVQTRSMLSGQLVVATPTVYELRHYFSSALTGGLGIPVGQGGANTEVYAQVAVARQA